MMKFHTICCVCLKSVENGQTNQPGVCGRDMSVGGSSGQAIREDFLEKTKLLSNVILFFL